MNYYGHAWIASERSRDPRFVLGAMWPDWLGWVGARLVRVDEPAVAAGIRFHYATDSAFHASPGFTRLVVAAGRALRAAGLGRGPARGAAHVGVELLLDGALLAREHGQRAYLDALEAGPESTDQLAWSRPEAADRAQEVIRHLRREGLPRAYADPEQVAERVARSLERRPRLRVPAEDRPALRDWARAAAPEIARDAPAILTETRERLAAA